MPLLVTHHRHPSTLATRRQTRLRRGAVTIWSLGLLMIAIILLMLVVNWTYLVLVNRHTLRLTDMLALSAVDQLLDEGRLADQALSQADDITAAQNSVLDPTTGFLKRNNDAVGASLRPQYDAGNAANNEVLVTAGRVNQPSLAVTGGNSFTSGAGFQNTLRVEVLRKTGGVNPVYLLMRGLGNSSNATATISAASFATLDTRVQGFRPKVNIPSPVAPLAISQGAWLARAGGGLDSNGNGRFELDVIFAPAAPSETLSGAGVNFFPGSNVVGGNLAGQISGGIVPANLNGTGLVGPAYTGNSQTLRALPTLSPADASSIATALNSVAVSNRPIRAYPLYGSIVNNGGNLEADIVGFVAARIILATVENVGGVGMNQPRLRVRLEPAFLIHNTVETGVGSPVATPENTYITKIRLTR